MASNLHLNELVKFLKTRSPVSTKELLNFYRQFTPNLPINTLRWRIYELKRQEVIYSPKRGLYALNVKKSFAPSPDERMLTISNLLQSKFPYVNFCLCPTQWLGKLTTHSYQSNDLIIEIDADVQNAAFHFLKEQFPNTFISPNQEMYDHYIQSSNENLIVNRLYVDAPLNKIAGNFYVPKIEKIIVDLLVNTPTIFPVSSAEIQTIIKNLLTTYNINYSTLMRYATKRNASRKLEKILSLQGEIK